MDLVSRPNIKKLLNITPFEGTLNIKVSSDDMIKLDILRAEKGARVEGFQEGGRTFGAVKAFPAELSGVHCAIIMPTRSHYSDVIEVVSEKHLRKTLSLKDSDDVELKLMLS